jgi:hypothetical protein
VYKAQPVCGKDSVVNQIITDDQRVAAADLGGYFWRGLRPLGREDKVDAVVLRKIERIGAARPKDFGVTKTLTPPVLPQRSIARSASTRRT